MSAEEFDYCLPESSVVQMPLKNRDQSRLLVLGRKIGNTAHKHFTNIMDYFEIGDTLMLDDTRIMSARLFGLKEGTGAEVEMLMFTGIEDNDWKVLLKPIKRIKAGNTLSFGNDKVIAECIKELEQSRRIMRLHFEGILGERLDELGETPLPPYTKERLDDSDRYQTVYAKENGSAAAPITGLHFIDEPSQEIKDKGVSIISITLHISLGTFKPINAEDINDHEMHSEYYQMTRETVDILNKTKENGHGIISVGATSVRTLETIRHDHGQFVATSDWTDIFIYPDSECKAIGGLITNFHLPESTLAMLASALNSRECILNACREAVKLKYGFLSFGDTMLII